MVNRYNNRSKNTHRSPSYIGLVLTLLYYLFIEMII
ncbi:Uncharacterised protein [Legionella spiritensis]|nr:Uncharacterised protein [Legionella spiritensis]